MYNDAMVLSQEQIMAAILTGDIRIYPFDINLLKKASYTFTIGGKLRKLKANGHIDSRAAMHEFDEFEIGQSGYILQPHEFVICHTRETLQLSDQVCCFLTMRGARAQIGIDSLQGEIFCEPGSTGGWNGQLMLETTNNGPHPVRLFTGVAIVKAVFFRLDPCRSKNDARMEAPPETYSINHKEANDHGSGNEQHQDYSRAHKLG